MHKELFYLDLFLFDLIQQSFSYLRKVFWFEQVLSKDKFVLLKDQQWRQWGSNLWPLSHESSTLLLSHCAPYIWTYERVNIYSGSYSHYLNFIGCCIAEVFTCEKIDISYQFSGHSILCQGNTVTAGCNLFSVI